MREADRRRVCLHLRRLRRPQGRRASNRLLHLRRRGREPPGYRALECQSESRATIRTRLRNDSRCFAPFEPFEGKFFHMGDSSSSYKYLVSYPVLCYAPPARGACSPVTCPGFPGVLAQGYVVPFSDFRRWLQFKGRVRIKLCVGTRVCDSLNQPWRLMHVISHSF